MYKAPFTPEQNELTGGIDTQEDFYKLPLQSWPAQWHPTEDFPTPQSVGLDQFSQVANSALSYDDDATVAYRLGETNLPVAGFRELFLDTVAQNQTTIIESETGSGKSSQLALYLIEEGYQRVFVTQPRILAARELMDRARTNLGPEYQHLGGYITGNASDSDCGPEARIIYVTEQLLFNMANRGGLLPGDAIMNDEAHERSVPMIVSMALQQDILRKYPYLKQIFSSATMDTGKFADYSLNAITGKPAPVLKLPGRTHPVTHLESDKSVADVMGEYTATGKNVLAFEPGISRMRKTAALAAKKVKSGGKVHLLYGDQSPAAQKAALSPEDNNHVIASRIGETSITPQNKNVVVDSGLSNIGINRAGVRILRTVFSSQDTMKQRAGRVGRTGPGIYVIAVPENTPPPPRLRDRPQYEMSAMEGSSVASYITELLAQGRRFEDLNLLESPTDENLQHDYKLLKRIGAIAFEGDEVVLTDIGRAMNDLPLDRPMGRMLIEARKTFEGDETPDDKLRLQVAAAIAIQQVKGILNTQADSQMRFLTRKSHKEKLSNEVTSDVLFQLDVFTKLFAKQQEMMASGMKDAEAQFEKLLIDTDILPNRYLKAVRTLEELCRREELNPLELQIATREQRRRIVACQITGAEELFVQRGKLSHRDIRGESRSLGRNSTIQLGELVVGVAFNLQGLRTSGRFERRYIAGGSAVSTAELLQHAPDRITRKPVGYGVNRIGKFVEKQSLYFDGELQFDEIESAVSPTLAGREALLTALMTGSGRSSTNPNHIVEYKPGTPRAEHAAEVYQRALELDNRSRASLKVAERYEKLIRKIVRESVETVPLDVTDPAELDKLIPPVYANALVRPSRRRRIADIIRTAPDVMPLHIDKEKRRYIPVGYRNGIAYVTVPRDLKYFVRPDSFDELREHHDIKLRVANGEYQFFDAFFNRVDEQRHSPKREKKTKHREEIAAMVASGGHTTVLPQDHHVSRKKLDAKTRTTLAKVNPTVRNLRRQTIRNMRDTAE